jgi:DNA-binding NarL/FixJ family response regulator
MKGFMMGKTKGLTPREMEVCDLLMNGATNRQIASALYVTENTVEFHMRNILDKLRVRNRTEVAVKLLQSV